MFVFRKERVDVYGVYIVLSVVIGIADVVKKDAAKDTAVGKLQVCLCRYAGGGQCPFLYEIHAKKVGIRDIKIQFYSVQRLVLPEVHDALEHYRKCRIMAQ